MTEQRKQILPCQFREKLFFRIARSVWSKKPLPLHDKNDFHYKRGYDYTRTI